MATTNFDSSRVYFVQSNSLLVLILLLILSYKSLNIIFYNNINIKCSCCSSCHRLSINLCATHNKNK